jgi:hypothetical protein
VRNIISWPKGTIKKLQRSGGTMTATTGTAKRFPNCSIAKTVYKNKAPPKMKKNALSYVHPKTIRVLQCDGPARFA